jgi:hypothetical protein
MEEKIESLILDIQDEAEKFCEYEDDSYQYILGLIEGSKLPKNQKDECIKILNKPQSLFSSYVKVVNYLLNKEEENDGYNG